MITVEDFIQALNRARDRPCTRTGNYHTLYVCFLDVYFALKDMGKVDDVIEFALWYKHNLKDLINAGVRIAHSFDFLEKNAINDLLTKHRINVNCRIEKPSRKGYWSAYRKLLTIKHKLKMTELPLLKLDDWKIRWRE